MKGLMQQVFKLINLRSDLLEIIHKVVIIRGIVESHLAELISSWEKELPSVIKLAYLPSKGYIRLRFTARGNDKIVLNDIINQQIDKLRLLVGDYFCPFQVLTLEEEIGELLKKNCCTISTAESCTGGAIASRITSVAGSSNYFKGSVVTYNDDMKIKILNVNPE